MIEWLSQLQEMLQTVHRVVIVSVTSVKGSTPREPGAKMLVSVNDVCNTIGGGHLEYKAIQLARNMLIEDLPNGLHRFSLGATLGQCCGGVVTLFFEIVTDRSAWVVEIQQFISAQQDCVQVVPVSNFQTAPRLVVSEDCILADEQVETLNAQKPLIKIARAMLKNDDCATIKKVAEIDYVFDPVTRLNFHILIFGAGHVGAAVVKFLTDLPCQLSWIDTRDDFIPDNTPHNVTAIITDIPEAVIEQAPAGSYFLVMTHDHSLDQHLTELILKRDDFSYFGLIGSVTKRKKFEHRLLQRGITVKQLSRMTCPIGISGIKSKSPAAIALAVTAELVQCYEQGMSHQLAKNKELIVL